MRPEIIVGYDGSPAAEATLRQGAVLRDALDGHLVAAYVYPPPGVSPDRPYDPVPLTAALGEHREVSERARMLAGAADAADERLAICAPWVGGALHRLAAERDALLLVAGIGRPASASRFAPDRVAEWLVPGSPCPVLMVPVLAVVDHLETIAIAYDGRPESRRALRLAAGLARRSDAALVVLAAVEAGPPAPRPATLEEIDRVLGGVTDQTLEELSELRIQGWLLDVPAAASIARACAGADLLVAGSRARGPLRKAVVGSVSRQLIDRAPCLVVVVPRTVRPSSLWGLEREVERS
jgi:nucleotide-binding universal stress UspA family protein